MELTAARARELLEYSVVSGRVYRKIRTAPQCPAGSLAGSLDYPSTGKPRLQITIDGRRYLLHRIIWLMVTGEWPERVIDHRNGDATNNSWLNLRDASRAVNSQNQRVWRFNKKHALPLGVTLVYPERIKPYRAAIHVKGRRLSLGFHATPEDAHAAYVMAKRAHHPGCEI